MLALSNAERLAAGGKSLGWILPSLYTNGTGVAVANDIVSGRNNCCAGQNISINVLPTHGYAAAKGWDPLTGFGSFD